MVEVPISMFVCMCMCVFVFVYVSVSVSVYVSFKTVVLSMLLVCLFHHHFSWFFSLKFQKLLTYFFGRLH